MVKKTEKCEVSGLSETMTVLKTNRIGIITYDRRGSIISGGQKIPLEPSIDWFLQIPGRD